MKLKLIALSLIAAFASLQGTAKEAPVQKSFKHVAFGLGPDLITPCFSVGYRERTQGFGWDTSLRASTSGISHGLEAFAAAHYHLSPLARQSAYVGAGVSLAGLIYNHENKPLLSLAPVFVIGKEFETEDMAQQFVELHVKCPSWIFQRRASRTHYPICTHIQYGIAF